MAENVGNFFYKLGIESDVSGLNKGLGKLASMGLKVGASLAGAVTGAKLFSNQFIEIDKQAKRFGQDAKYIFRVRKEFEFLQMSAEEGSAYVANMSELLRDLQLKGEFRTGLGMILGKEAEKLQGITGIDELTSLLRTGAQESPERLRAFLSDAGLSDSDFNYLIKTNNELIQARRRATEATKRINVDGAIRQAKLLSNQIANFKTQLQIFAVKFLPTINKLMGVINDKLVPTLNFLNDNMKEVAIGLVALKALPLLLGGGKLAGLGKGAGAGTGVLAKLGLGAVGGLGFKKSLETENKALGYAGAAGSGALIGGTLGSIVPGAGTLLGAGVGAGGAVAIRGLQDFMQFLIDAQGQWATSAPMGKQALAGAGGAGTGGNTINNYNNISVASASDIGTTLRAIENQTVGKI